MVVLDFALKYLDMGLRVIPLKPRQKTPAIESWKKYQVEMPNVSEVREWFKNPLSNIGVVTGDGVLVVDLDGKGAEEALNEKGVFLPHEAPRSATGKGQHVWLKVMEMLPNAVRIAGTKACGVDIRCDGGYVVVPPSIHESGIAYSWIRPIDGDLPDAPRELLALIEGTKKKEHEKIYQGDTWITKALSGVGEGQRNDTCTRLAGYFLSKSVPPDVTARVLADFGKKCSPPFPDGDVDRVVKSVSLRYRKGEIDRPLIVSKLSDVLHNVWEGINRGDLRPLPTPFSELNRLLFGGLLGGEVMYLAGTPGVGKTVLAIQTARAAAEKGNAVLVVSREMSCTSLGRRLIAQESGVRAGSLRMARVSDSDKARVMAAMSKVSGLPMWITDTALTVSQSKRAITELLSEHAVRLLVLDYLQLLHAEQRFKDRRLEIESVSKDIKSLAVELDMPVICISALSQEGGLRESRALEYDADVIVFVERERGSSEAKVQVKKNRNGMTGDLILSYDAERLMFYDAPKNIIQADFKIASAGGDG